MIKHLGCSNDWFLWVKAICAAPPMLMAMEQGLLWRKASRSLLAVCFGVGVRLPAWTSSSGGLTTASLKTASILDYFNTSFVFRLRSAKEMHRWNFYLSWIGKEIEEGKNSKGCLDIEATAMSTSFICSLDGLEKRQGRCGFRKASLWRPREAWKTDGGGVGKIDVSLIVRFDSEESSVS